MNLLLKINIYYYGELSIDYNNYYFFNIIILIKKLTKLGLKSISGKLYLYYSNKLIIFFYIYNIYTIYTKKNQLKISKF